MSESVFPSNEDTMKYVSITRSDRFSVDRAVRIRFLIFCVDSSLLIEGECRLSIRASWRGYAPLPIPFCVDIIPLHLRRVCFVVFLHCSSIYMFERESVLVVAALCEPVTVKDTA